MDTVMRLTVSLVSRHLPRVQSARERVDDLIVITAYAEKWALVLFRLVPTLLYCERALLSEIFGDRVKQKYTLAYL